MHAARLTNRPPYQFGVLLLSQPWPDQAVEAWIVPSPIAAWRCRPRPASPGLLFSAGGLLVDTGAKHSPGSDLRQKLVGVGLLVERLIEDVSRIVETELVGERRGGSVARNLVVLNALGSGNQGRILRQRSPWAEMIFSPSRIRPSMPSHFSDGELIPTVGRRRSEEHTSELQSHHDLVCRLLLEKK